MLSRFNHAPALIALLALAGIAATPVHGAEPVPTSTSVPKPAAKPTAVVKPAPKPATAKPAAPGKASKEAAKKTDPKKDGAGKPVAKAAAGAAVAGAALAPAILLSHADQSWGREAMREAKAGKFDKAREAAAKAKDPLVGRLVHWLWLQTPNSGAPFEAIAEFIEKSPDWPAREALLRRADESVNEAVGDTRIIQWYTQRPPESGLGWLRYAEALDRQSRSAEALAAVRKAWTDGNLSLRDENDVWREFGNRLTPAENAARLDRLLWDAQYDAARRMLPRVDGEAKILGEARLALALRTPAADKIAAMLPQKLREDGGLAYEQMRWNRREGKDDIVESLLYNAPDELGRAEKWWVERHFRARKALIDGRISEAYRLASNHGLSGGSSYTEAEWLAGWIALRLLQEPQIAVKHFAALQSNVRTPVSQSRAGYWLGRTYTITGDQAQARHWYAQASKHATTFYGQLATFALDPKARLQLPDDPEPSAAAIAQFDKREVVRAAKILVELGQEDRLRPFILRLAHTADTLEEHQLAARLARMLNRVDLAVAATKRTARYAGLSLVREAFPLVEPMAQTAAPETALVLAVARQESEFNQHAVSPVGARGLMQLMPATAKGVAKEVKQPYSPAKLTDDAHYNVRLGSHYLDGLLRNWDSNYILALVSYNAGEARARKWIKDWGDPRYESIDAVDWIELIPFSETRNYVQRVLEGVQVYRALLRGAAPTADRLQADLRGLPRKACAAATC
jgi:soluble lytic murein transglycosylase